MDDLIIFGNLHFPFFLISGSRKNPKSENAENLIKQVERKNTCIPVAVSLSFLQHPNPSLIQESGVPWCWYRLGPAEPGTVYETKMTSLVL